MNDSKKYGLTFLIAFVAAGTVLATLVFPFWNLIRDDVYEEVVILNNYDRVCYVDTSDTIPKTISNCTAEPGSTVTVKYGEGMAWAVIESPPEDYVQKSSTDDEMRSEQANPFEFIKENFGPSG